MDHFQLRRAKHQWPWIQASWAKLRWLTCEYYIDQDRSASYLISYHQEFGNDRIGEDNYSSPGSCLRPNEQEALVTAHTEAHQQSHQLLHTSHPPPPPKNLNTASSNDSGATQSIRIPPGPGSNTMNLSFAPGTAVQCRMPPQPQGLGCMAGIGHGFRLPGQSLPKIYWSVT